MNIFNEYMRAKQEVHALNYSTGESFKLNVKPTPYRTRPMTKLQKAHNKSYIEGRSEVLSQLEDMHKMLSLEKQKTHEVSVELETANNRIKSLRAVMQSINAISQGTSYL